MLENEVKAGAYKAPLEIASELKKAGLGIEFIAKTTGLDIEEVENLDAPLDIEKASEARDDYVWKLKRKWDSDNVMNYAIGEQVDKRTDLTPEEKDYYKLFLKKRFDKLWEARNIKRSNELPDSPQLSNQEIADRVGLSLENVEYFSEKGYLSRNSIVFMHSSILFFCSIS